MTDLLKNIDLTATSENTTFVVDAIGRNYDHIDPMDLNEAAHGVKAMVVAVDDEIRADLESDYISYTYADVYEACKIYQKWLEESYEEMLKAEAEECDRFQIDYCDGSNNVTETFRGSWNDVQDYITVLKEANCSNIAVTEIVDF